MSISGRFRSGDLVMVAAVAIVIGIVITSLRMLLGLPAVGEGNIPKIGAFILLSMLLAAALVAIQRMRPPQSAAMAVAPAIILGCIPLAVAFVFRDLNSAQALTRHLVNIAAVVVAAIVIFAWSQRDSKVHPESFGSPGNA